MEDWAEIRRLHRAEGLSQAAIARHLGIPRNTAMIDRLVHHAEVRNNKPLSRARDIDHPPMTPSADTVQVMDLVRSVVVFDAADLEAESAFWATLLGGHVIDDDDDFHCVVDAEREWRVGVQLAPDHQPPQWPDGAPQQLHLDLHVTDPHGAHETAMAAGARLLHGGDLTAEEGYQVYADPAGHPFCLCWGQPSPAALDAFLRDRLG